MKAERSQSVLRTIPWLFAACLASVPAQAKYSGGAGTSDDPYQIWTPEQMNAIGAEPNDWDKHFKLMADIDLGQYPADEFNVIGFPHQTNPRPFAGVFDGNGHTISNFTWSSNAVGCVGIFGYVARPFGYSGHPDDFDPEVRNLELLNPHVDAGGRGFVGSLVGYLSQARVVNCYARDAVVSGGSDVGGLIGRVESGTVTACYSTGTVTGGNSTGGLIGANRACVMNCYSQSNVRGKQGTGVLVGFNIDDGAIVNCYARGTASGTYGVGAVAGDGRGAVVGSYWDVQISGPTTGAGGSGKSTAEMYAASTFRGWTPGNGERMWTIDEGKDYPRLYWEDRPGRDLAGVQLGDLLVGAGTSDSPFLIRSADELDLIGQFPYDWNKHFRLTADIDLSEYSGATFHIIGAFRLPFTGSFDGDNHTISSFQYTGTDGSYRGLFGCISGANAEVRNLTLLAPTIVTRAGESLGGLAGALEYGTIKGCRVKNAVITGCDTVSSLVPYNHKGTITDCHATGTVTGIIRGVQVFAGGLTAYNDGVLRNCSSGGIIRGGQYVGGVTGGNINYGSMATCSSTCIVAGESEVGGLIGRNSYESTVTNCYCTGSVIGITRVGGLVGCNEGGSTVVKCYAAGLVTGMDNVGGLVGKDYYGLANAQASYWDVVATGQTASAGGKGLTTVEMQLRRTFLGAGWDFVDETANGTEDTWWIDEGKDYPRLWWEAACDPNSALTE